MFSYKHQLNVNNSVNRVSVLIVHTIICILLFLISSISCLQAFSFEMSEKHTVEMIYYALLYFSRAEIAFHKKCTIFRRLKRTKHIPSRLPLKMPCAMRHAPAVACSMRVVRLKRRKIVHYLCVLIGQQCVVIVCYGLAIFVLFFYIKETYKKLLI